MISMDNSFLTNFFSKVTEFTKSHTRSALFVFAVVAASFFVYFVLFSSQDKGEIYTVDKIAVTQLVNVTGEVEPAKDAVLSFQSSGQVAFIGVKVGDKVRQGQTLATLSGADAQASLLSAQASLENALATEAQLMQGSRPEEIAIKQQNLDSANSSLSQAYETLPDVIRNVDTVTSDVVKNKIAPLFTYQGGRYSLSFASCDQRLQSEIETDRLIVEKELQEFQKKSSVITMISSQETIESTFNTAYLATVSTNNLIIKLVTLLFAPCSTSNSSYDGYRATVSSARTTLTSLFTDITAKKNSVSQAISVYMQAKKDLELTQAGTDPLKLRAQAALVSQARAGVAQAEAVLSKTVIRSPFSGTVSDVSIKIGETVTSGKTAVSILALEQFQIEANIPEVDIVKIKEGNYVDITLDAYGSGVIFPAMVTRISPSAITEGGIPVYKVLITFSKQDERIRSGMTANMKIVTMKKEAALAVPSRFITFTDSSAGSASVLSADGTVSERKVIVGVRGENGFVEILSGLNGGDILVSPTTGDRSAQKQTK